MLGRSSNRLALDDAYRAFMDAWNASHPGSAAAGAAANAAVDCADFAPAPDVVRADLFTDDELATESNHSYELHIDGSIARHTKLRQNLCELEPRREGASAVDHTRDWERPPARASTESHP